MSPTQQRRAKFTIEFMEFRKRFEDVLNTDEPLDLDITDIIHSHLIYIDENGNELMILKN
ncbi:hypothetical protein [Caudoviricetes sp.]|nr:hypothetical protein [Caudoviricetes sp.]